MAIQVQFSNIAQQIGLLGQTLPANVEERWKANAPDMIEKMGDTLAQLVDVEVFQRKADPTGAAWAGYADLTRDIYQRTGRPLEMGGRKLRQSFQIGGRGNLWRAKKWGFSYGSQLRAKGYLVGRTFQTAYKMPKSASDFAAANRMRRYFRKIGIKPVGDPPGLPPAVGGQLKHPARRILIWTDRWERKLEGVALDYLAKSVAESKKKTTTTMSGAQRMLDARRRA